MFQGFFKSQHYTNFELFFVCLFLSAFDCDSVGHISFQELLIALSITSYGDLKERVQLAFKIFDLGNFINEIMNKSFNI